MVRNRWVKAAVLCSVLALTNTVTFYKDEILNTFRVAESVKSDETSEDLFGKNAKVRVAILVPDTLLGDDRDENFRQMQTFLSKKYAWEEVSWGKVPVPGFKGQTGFVFKVVSDQEVSKAE